MCCAVKLRQKSTVNVRDSLRLDIGDLIELRVWGWGLPGIQKTCGFEGYTLYLRGHNITYYFAGVWGHRQSLDVGAIVGFRGLEFGLLLSVYHPKGSCTHIVYTLA